MTMAITAVRLPAQIVVASISHPTLFTSGAFPSIGYERDTMSSNYGKRLQALEQNYSPVISPEIRACAERLAAETGAST
jgi:hypothetical protein